MPWYGKAWCGTARHGAAPQKRERRPQWTPFSFLSLPLAACHPSLSEGLKRSDVVGRPGSSQDGRWHLGDLGEQFVSPVEFFSHGRGSLTSFRKKPRKPHFKKLRRFRRGFSGFYRVNPKPVGPR